MDFIFIWEDYRVEKVSMIEITQDEVEFVIENCFEDWFPSRSSGRPMVEGMTHTGRLISCVFVFEEVEGVVYVIPKTAWVLFDREDR